MLIYRSDVVGNAQKVQRWSIRGCTDGVRRRTGYYRDVQVVSLLSDDVHKRWMKRFR
jgi:hypothetical protein